MLTGVGREDYRCDVGISLRDWAALFHGLSRRGRSRRARRIGVPIGYVQRRVVNRRIVMPLRPAQGQRKNVPSVRQIGLGRRVECQLAWVARQPCDGTLDRFDVSRGSVMTSHTTSSIRSSHSLSVLCIVSATGLALFGGSVRAATEDHQAAASALEQQWAQRHLTDVVVTRFRFLQQQSYPAYETVPRHKAGAACMAWDGDDGAPYVPFWGGAWEVSSSDQAAKEAISNCQQAKNGAGDCACTLVLSDDAVVLTPPAKAVAAAIASLPRKAPPTLCSNWFSGSSSGSLDRVTPVRGCSGYSDDSVHRLVFVVNHILQAARSTSAPEIFPAPPVARKSEFDVRRPTDKSTGELLDRQINLYPPTMGYMFWTPYRTPAPWKYEFAINRVPAERQELVLSALRDLERSKMYGRFKPLLALDVTLPFFTPSDLAAYYARVYDVSDPAVKDAFPRLDPEASRDGLLHGEHSTRLWVESLIPVDEDWTPVGQPLRSVTPIAVQTNQALYLYSVELVPERAGGGSIGHFEGRVFDLSACARISPCVQAALTVLAEELTKAFRSSPYAVALSAAPVKNRLLPPSQVRLQRITEESVVLRGVAGPYFEMSTYTATYWPGPRGSFLGDAGNFYSTPSTNSAPLDQVYLQVEQALQISVGRKGSYEEPTTDQYAAYGRAVTDAVNSAIAQTAKRLGGIVQADGVGIISNWAAPQ